MTGYLVQRTTVVVAAARDAGQIADELDGVAGGLSGGDLSPAQTYVASVGSAANDVETTAHDGFRRTSVGVSDLALGTHSAAAGITEADGSVADSLRQFSVKH